MGVDERTWMVACQRGHRWANTYQAYRSRGSMCFTIIEFYIFIYLLLHVHGFTPLGLGASSKPRVLVPIESKAGRIGRAGRRDGEGEVMAGGSSGGSGLQAADSLEAPTPHGTFLRSSPLRHDQFRRSIWLVDPTL